MNNKELVIAVLEDYCQLQLDGKVDQAGRYSVSDVSAAINELIEPTITVLAKAYHNGCDIYTVVFNSKNYVVIVDCNTYTIGSCLFNCYSYPILKSCASETALSSLNNYIIIVKQLKAYIEEQKP